MSWSDTSTEKVVLVGCELKSSQKKIWFKQSSLSLEESIDELASLATAAGARVTGRLTQQRDRYDPTFLIGKGKIRLLKTVLKQNKANTVIFDDNLSPAQQRNIEKFLDCKVLDRTQLILDIFAYRAATREGKLQVELAQLNYMLPRLAGRGIELSRLGAGLGTRGPGETKLETDQRKIHQRIYKIRKELEQVRIHRRLHRSFRKSVPVPIVSLVGYTNAGKSTLFNALTHDNTLASKQLFATLDPLLRRLQLPSGRKIILSDTVGFISKLPATLISAFRATLEEIGESELILHVIDGSSSGAEQQRGAVIQVLKDLGVMAKPHLEVFNKTDLLSHSFRPTQGRVWVSALQKKGISTLLQRIDELITDDPLVQAKFLVERHRGELLSRIFSRGRVINCDYRNNQVMVEIEAPRSFLKKIEAQQIKNK